MATKISALPSASTPLGNTDVFPITQSATTGKVAWSTILDNVSDALTAKVIDISGLTLSVPDANTLNIDDTSEFTVGYPVRIVQSAVTRHCVVTAISADTSVTVAGGPLAPATSVTEVRVGRASELIQMDLLAPGYYAAGGTTNDLLLRTTKNRLLWLFSSAYLVQAFVSHNTPDGGAAEPTVNIRVDGTDVFSENSNAGAELPASTSFIELKSAALANYQINRGDAIELALTGAGTNETAQDLSVTAVFVLA